MFEIKKSNLIKIKIYDSEHEVMKPKFKDVIVMQNEINELGDKNAASITKKFLVALGMPEATIDEMELDHINELVSFLITKKN